MSLFANLAINCLICSKQRSRENDSENHDMERNYTPGELVDTNTLITGKQHHSHPKALVKGLMKSVEAIVQDWKETDKT